MDLLEKLCTTPGVPGREARIRRIITEAIDGLFDEVTTDTLGSLIAIRKPKDASGRTIDTGKTKPKRVMVAAHMDQIGFLVNHVGGSDAGGDKGFLRVVPAGGFDTRNLFARLVTICPDLHDPSKDIPGVMNPTGRPIHIASDEDKKKIPEIKEFAIDAGLPAEELAKRVKVGDMVVLRAPFEQIGQTIVSQCLDNRVACWIAIRAVQQAAKVGHRCEIACVFTVQEEVGLRGARTAAYALKPDVGIGLDTTLAVDVPDVPSHERVTSLGKGAGVTCMDSASIGDYDLIEQFTRLAQDRAIPHQRSILNRGGTDSGTIQQARAGVRTMTLSVPTRYIHSVTEMIHTTDLHATRDLLAAYLETAQ